MEESNKLYQYKASKYVIMALAWVSLLGFLVNKKCNSWINVMHFQMKEIIWGCDCFPLGIDQMVKSGVKHIPFIYIW